MSKRKKLTALILAAAMTVAGAGGDAMAASKAKEKKRITTVRLTVTDDLRLGEDIEDENFEISSNADNYEVTGVEVMNGSFYWTAEDTPRVEVTLETDDEHEFSVWWDRVKIKGDKATVVTFRKDAGALILTLDLQPMSERVGGIENAVFNGTTAVWDAAEGAESYELYLYRDGSAVGGRRSTSETSYHFEASMRKKGTYYYRICPVGREGMKPGEYVKSEEYYKQENDSAGREAQEGSSGSPGEWVQDSAGWWWKNPDGTWPSNVWMQLAGKWYYFGEDGYMATGWISSGGSWYYLGPDGAMWTSCMTPDGFRVNAEGVREP